MARLSILPYELPCEERARVYFPHGLRSGLLLLVSLSDGSFGLGEYAPLAGIHDHSIDAVMSLIKAVRLDDVERYFNDKKKGLDKIPFAYPLSLLFSSAYYHRALMRGPYAYTGQAIELSALISERSIEDAVSAARHFLDLGFRCLKIKIGAGTLEDEIEKVSQINALSEGGAFLRLDANKRFNLKEAKYLAIKLEHANIQYIEEPLSNALELYSLVKDCGLPVAIDESYVPTDPLSSLKKFSARYLIIKPSRFNSLFEVQSLCEEAKQLAIMPIFSTCFESEFFCSLMALFCHDLELLSHFHGVMSPGFFRAEKSLSARQGKLSLEEAYAVIREKGLNLHRSVAKL